MSGNQILLWESNPITKQMAALQAVINQYEAAASAAPQLLNDTAYSNWLKSVFNKGEGMAAALHMPVRPLGGGVEGQDYYQETPQMNNMYTDNNAFQQAMTAPQAPTNMDSSTRQLKRKAFDPSIYHDDRYSESSRESDITNLSNETTQTYTSQLHDLLTGYNSYIADDDTTTKHIASTKQLFHTILGPEHTLSNSFIQDIEEDPARFHGLTFMYKEMTANPVYFNTQLGDPLGEMHPEAKLVHELYTSARNPRRQQRRQTTSEFSGI